MAEPTTHRPGEPPQPLFLALLICDHTIRDGETGKVSLIGIFANIQALDFPVLNPGLSVYVNMDDAEGEYLMRLELLRVEDMETLGAGEMKVTFSDRMLPSEVIFDLRNLVFDRAGEYKFRVLANGRTIGDKTFRVLKIPGGKAT